MCKVLAMAGIPRANVANAWKFAQAALKPMTKNDKDGVGYAAMTPKGALFGERWIVPKEAFRNRSRVLDSDKAWTDRLGKAVKATDRYNGFGALEFESASAIILHSRMATCDVSMANTHPFVIGNTALIHNGVISNSNELTMLQSTCDSETILNEYVESDVAGNPARIQEVADALRGYYACAVLTHDGLTPVLDIFKDDAARLVATWVDEIGTIVFATNEEILRTAAKKCRFHLRSVYDIEAGQLIRLNVETGATVGITAFEPGLQDSLYWRRQASIKSQGPAITFTRSESAFKPAETSNYLPSNDDGPMTEEDVRAALADGVIDEEDVQELIRRRIESDSHLKGA